jgi:hypothetical protein
MSNNKGVNITKYMLGNTKPSISNKSISTGNYKTPINLGSEGAGGRSTIGQILAYILAIAIVILVILLFINFFITPIFRLRPGGPGIIPVPGFDDGKLFWNKKSPGHIQNKDLPIATQSYGYSLNLDVFVENPLQFSTTPRVFFSRGASSREHPSGDTLMGIYNNYNLVAALLPDTNDLLVSVLNKDNNMENVIISNIPTQQPFRLSIVVMEQALEVYMNGQLIKTRHFAAPPKDVKGDIYPSTGIEINTVKVRNLKIWTRILTVSEIRQATPTLSTAKQFGALPMPGSTTSSTCGKSTSTAVNNLETSMQSNADRLSKLSVDTVSDVESKLI